MTNDPLQRYGWNDERAAEVDALSADTVAGTGTDPGRVLRHDGVAVLLATHSTIATMPLAPGCDAVVVGDWVLVDENHVRTVLPRSSLLRRRDAILDAEQPLVANLDAVFVVCGLDRPVKATRIHRLLTLAHDAHVEATVVLSKADAAEDLDGALAVAAAAATATEHRLLAVSALEGTGMVDLLALCAGRTVALLGESGAGKSTLVNTLLGDDVAATASVRRGDAKGRHTTTTRQLHALPNGGVVVDTPGIRAVGLWTDTEAVDAAFEDLAELASTCRFANCEHRTEPGCAVLDAIEHGALDASRLAAWHELLAEAEASDAQQAQNTRLRGRRARR